MIHTRSTTTSGTKQRLTAFINPDIITRARVRGALEGLSFSEVVEKALDVYAPKIEKAGEKDIKVKFTNIPELDNLIPRTETSAVKTGPRHSKLHVVPR